MVRILLVEDDADLSERVAKWLIMESHTVDRVATGTEAIEYLQQRVFDVILLDWQLPEMQGIDILRYYRSGGGMSPVLMLTGRAELDDRERGLDAGADDYLIKPFQMRELSARIRALSRRPPQVICEQLTAGDLTMDTGTHAVSRNGQQIELLPLEFSLLEFFMRNQGRVFPAEALLERVWPVNSDTSPDAVRTVIKTLRRKIDHHSDHSVIRTIHGVGYKLEP